MLFKSLDIREHHQIVPAPLASVDAFGFFNHHKHPKALQVFKNSLGIW
jgi:hypothetical protein